MLAEVPTRPPLLVTERLLLRELRARDATAVSGAGRRSASGAIFDRGTEPVSDRARDSLGHCADRVVAARPRRDTRDHPAQRSRCAARQCQPAAIRQRSPRRARLLARHRRVGQRATRAQPRARLSTSDFASSSCRGSTRRCSKATRRRAEVLEKLGMLHPEGIRRRDFQKGRKLLDVVRFGMVREEWEDHAAG